jgi:hypothetical protein
MTDTILNFMKSSPNNCNYDIIDDCKKLLDHNGHASSPPSMCVETTAIQSDPQKNYAPPHAMCFDCGYIHIIIPNNLCVDLHPPQLVRQSAETW